jgi:transposase
MENVENWSQIVAEKDARIAELEALVRFYEEQFRLSKLRQFGPSSEKSVLSGQLGFFDEIEATADPSLPEPELEQITYARRKRVGKREDDLSGLPVEVVEHALAEEECLCPECGGELHKMGCDVHRELKIIPAQVKVVERNRSVYSCRNCEKNNDHVPVVKAPMPEPVIKGSLASPSAVAHIMTQKYVMHVPLYRQEQNWKRQGVALSRQTMANWVIRCAEDWLRPVYNQMRTLLLLQEVCHADETVVQVLREPGKAPTTNSYMWLYRTSGDTKRHIILYEYQPSRSHIHPKQFLANFKGLLHADGYAGYHKLPPEITVVGCWVHLRRKFTDALKVIPAEEKSASVTQEALKKIGYLFHLEERWKDFTSEERHKRRIEESKPLAEEFFAWLEKLKVLPKSATGKAIHYALEQRRWLMHVYLDGRAELSNNRIENAVRPFAVGRRNWLFCNTVNGADASAIVYSIIETAKANGLKPFEYLEFLFETMPNTTIKVIEGILPWGGAVPTYCRMPISKDGGQHAEKERDEVHDGVRSRVS